MGQCNIDRLLFADLQKTLDRLGAGVKIGMAKSLVPLRKPVQWSSTEIDMQTVMKLAEMGFPLNGCKRAVYTTGNCGVDAAMAWVMDHMGDADFAEEFVFPGTKPKQSNFKANPDSVAMIVAMGFTPEQATKALQATNNNIERAADWIFSHADELDAAVAMETDQAPAPQSHYRDGSEKYKLVAFISHMGTSTMVGHYVCHILKDGKWIIFNDNKVAASEHPPKDLGYLYLYRRV